jgi:drug/metabolite transporter (DMT)-like permease
MPPYAGDAMALSCALAWAVAVLLLRRLSAQSPVALNLFKNTLAATLHTATLFATGGSFSRERTATDWLLLVVSGVLGLAIADSLFLAGLRRIEASVAAVTDCIYSPSVVLLSALALRESLGPGLLVGGPLVVLGLLVVVIPVGRRARPIDRGGVALALGGVFTTAVAVIVCKPVLDRSSLIEATAIRLWAGSAVLFAFEASFGRARSALALFRPQREWRVAIPAALMGTYVAMLLWLGGIKYGTASRASILNQMGAIFVLVLSAIVLGERPPLLRWLGAALAVSGVVVIVAL